MGGSNQPSSAEGEGRKDGLPRLKNRMMEGKKTEVLDLHVE